MGKGYEVGKGEYLELDPEELEAVAIESNRVIDIDEFVPKKEIDELYLNNPYYIVPDGEVGTQAFAVIREAIKQEGMVSNLVFRSDGGLQATCAGIRASVRRASCWNVCPR
jgi:DNA end-binding protein Ku